MFFSSSKWNWIFFSSLIWMEILLEEIQLNFFVDFFFSHRLILVFLFQTITKKPFLVISIFSSFSSDFHLKHFYSLSTEIAPRLFCRNSFLLFFPLTIFFLPIHNPKIQKIPIFKIIILNSSTEPNWPNLYPFELIFLLYSFFD